MVKIEASTLEEAYGKAAQELDCSVTDIECEITQYPSNGFLGFGKKKAILVAVKKTKSCIQSTDDVACNTSDTREKTENVTIHKTDISPSTVNTEKEAQYCSPTVGDTMASTEDEVAYEEPQNTHAAQAKQQDTIHDSFFQHNQDSEEICEEIASDINTLFASSCFELDPICVSMYDADTVLISFSGTDSALLIGKEGYRYKALSYLFFNWINTKYGLLIRLEIAEFLKNQEEMVRGYLVPVIHQIRERRYGQTKVLDGVLIQIALRQLRDEFSDLYVGVKTNDDGTKFIIINEFYARQKC